MRGKNFEESLTRSLDRQRRLLGASLILTPVDSISLSYDQQDVAGFLHGLYISDKVKSDVQKQNSIIQFAGRERATRDLNLIHREFAASLGAAENSLRLLSGLHAHIAVFMSLAGIGESVLLLPEIAGGHFATKGILQRLGLKVIDMPVDLTRLCIDRVRTMEIMRRERPAFVFVDRSEGLRYEDFRFIGEISGAVKLFDASHYLPQIMCGIYENPFTWGFDLMIFTLHKSFPGPQKAGVAARESGEIWSALSKGLGELVSSSHVESSYRAGLVLAKGEALQEYTTRLLDTALALEECLFDAGLPVLRRIDQGQPHWPATHHIWLPLGSQEHAFQLYRALSRIRIHTNYRLLPYRLGWGLRMGTTAAAVGGLCPSDATEVADIISNVFNNGPSAKARHRVRALAQKLRLSAMTAWPQLRQVPLQRCET